MRIFLIEDDLLIKSRHFPQLTRRNSFPSSNRTNAFQITRKLPKHRYIFNNTSTYQNSGGLHNWRKNNDGSFDLMDVNSMPDEQLALINL